MDQSHNQGETSSQDRAHQLAGGTIEVVGIPAGTASTIRKKSSAVGIGGISGTRGTGRGNGVVRSAVVARSTGSVVAVGDGGTGTRGVGRSTTLTLRAKSAVGGGGGGGGLDNSWVLAVGNGGGSGGEGAGARRGVGSGNTGGLVNLMVLVRLAQNGGPVPGRGVGVRSGVHLGVRGGLGQGGGAGVGGQ